ncbi:ectonucleotide pyrophosphatase phosphodiesterase family member 3 isoform X2 [Pelobates cultripes]|uniref:Ectonucleotide pyrophosphatase phosphodiesterase family member 3 isoform X2 n=1 Tax=Pelobates cultripes TaxID=61616 RepID=A0AAD1VQR8_PELCU|nr:ectonucleotide pyrophosphatase phosphodiesterase family member 3 isoform X2 [Pelobates cultripes]
MSSHPESRVLFVALVAMSLGLGLGLGLKKDKIQEPALVTCRNRCYDMNSIRDGDCRCDAQCIDLGNCCFDYYDLCQKPKEEWTCSRVRCAERRISGSHCSCSDDCLEQGDCCTNYKEICKGDTPWATDKCETSTNAQCPEGFDLPPVILFSLDGFRAEYLQTWGYLMPNIEKLKNCGTHSKYMRAVYPTKTFPNHYTIVTGRHSPSAGPAAKGHWSVHVETHYTISGREVFMEGCAISAQHWPSELFLGRKGCVYALSVEMIVFGQLHPLERVHAEEAEQEELRMRVAPKATWWELGRHQQIPQRFTWRLGSQSCNGGTYSSKVIAALLLADRTMGMLLDGLKQRNLHNCVNLIILADHGMEKTYCDQLEYMTDYFEKVNFWLYDGPAARIRAYKVPDDYYTFDSEGTVKNLTCQKPDQHFKPYMTYDLPKRFHYANHIRIDKVHLYVDRQWLAVKDKSYTFCGGGNHGYDNEFKSMEAIFIGHGPGFKRGVEVEPFDNIEVYNLMCDLLKIQPAPNNGTHGSLNHLLAQPSYTPSHLLEKSTPSTCLFSQPTSNLSCSCNYTESQELLNQRLNLTAESSIQKEAKYLPYGRPANTEENSTYCVLYQETYVSGYSHDILMPLWSAYTIEKQGATSPLPPTLEECLRSDPRIPEATSQKCSDYKPEMSITHSFLHPPNDRRNALEQYDSLITSNIVPMYKEFKKIWDYLHTVLMFQYASERNGMNVVSGPVFDYNYDGHVDRLSEIKQHVEGTDIPIPTHYFVVLTSCNDTTHDPLNCPSTLDVLSFIIPHRPDNTESCADSKPESEWVEERLRAHAARVRDVELLTGLNFYQGRNQPIPEILQVKTYLPTFETVIN